MKFEHTEVFNFEGAIRGIRNSWDSHEKSDSGLVCKSCGKDRYFKSHCPHFSFEYVIGANDMKLAKNLIKAGSSHAKFMRQILVCVDITAPLYWWKQFDQYKIGTVTNSESTMHRITAEPFKIEQFAVEKIDFLTDEKLITWTHHILMEHLAWLNELRKDYLNTKDKGIWKAVIQLLPDGWLQKRTTTMNYAVLANIYHDRKRHKLTEWNDVCDWIATLPYKELITGE